MKIFVTGGTGFIGRHVVEQLAERQHELMLLVRNERDASDRFAGEKQIKFISGDLSEIGEFKGLLRDFEPDVTLHLAWEGLPDYGVETCLRNLRYGQDLFATAAQIGCKCIVSTGSCWEYRKAFGRLNEDSEIESSKVFPAVKNLLRLAAQVISKEYGIKFYWPRIFFVYGPGQRSSSLIPQIIRSFRDGLAPEIRNPNNKNDFVYVKDVADAIVRIIEEQPEKSIYNIGSGCSTSVYEIVSVVSAMMGCRFELSDVQGVRSADVCDDFYADIASIRHDLEWSPKYSLLDGIKGTVGYYAGCKEMVKQK